MTSCFVFKVIRDLLIDRSPDLSVRVSSCEVFKLKFYLTVVNKILSHCHSWLARQYKARLYEIHFKKQQ